MRRELLPIIVVAALTVAPAAVANDLGNVPALQAAADVVAVARLERQESRWSADGRRIVTHVHLELRDTRKGAPGRRVVVLQPGGTVGDIVQRVTGTPVLNLTQGEEVLVFLEARPAGHYRVLAFQRREAATKVTLPVRQDVGHSPAAVTR